MKIALVHDYLKEYGGAERVLEALHSIWPDAPVYTSFIDYESLGPHAERIKTWNVKTSWANNWFMKKMHSPLRFLAPWVWESFDFSGFDVVISSAGWYMCKGIITLPETVHISYIHHPPRHLYGYATAVEWQKFFLIRWYAMVVNYFLRQYDFVASQRPDFLLANSQETRQRIEKFYRRDATVIYPPVSVSVSPIKSKNTREYYLCVSRLARAKHIDLAIKACQTLGIPLKIVGKGRDLEYLKTCINPRGSVVTFLGEVSDDMLHDVYGNAKALLFPSEDEEFGIVAVEAMAHGVPVIGLYSGGIPEVIDEHSGVLFQDLTVDSMVTAMNTLEIHFGKSITAQTCIKRSQLFSAERFAQEISAFVEKKFPIYQNNNKK